MGENNWRLSFKDKAYDYFNRTIELLRGSKEKREMMLLSYYYGAEMSFLMNDSRIEEALKVGFEREKQIERLKAVPQISEDYIDGQYSYLYAKLAYIYCMEKKYEKAEQYYQKYLSKEELSIRPSVTVITHQPPRHRALSCLVWRGFIPSIWEN